MAGSNSIEVNEEDFAERVLAASAHTPVLVDFWADWCPPCRVLTPILERLADEYAGRFVLAKVEADENMRLAGRYKLRGFPTAILIVNGESVDQFSGARPPDFVREFLHQHPENPPLRRQPDRHRALRPSPPRGGVIVDRKAGLGNYRGHGAGNNCCPSSRAPQY
jgi:thioredoxin 1